MITMVDRIIELEKAMQEAIKLMDLQSNRTLYRMDDQIKTQKQVKEFIRKWQTNVTKNTP